MIEDLILKQQGKYSKKDLDILELQENILQFDHFDSQDALKLATTLIDCSIKYEEGIAFNIQRTRDEGIIFQYMDDNKAQRNINFAQMKRNTVLCTKHNSLWALIKSVVDTKVELDEKCLPVGGAYPIFVGEEMVATIALSGLHYGNDFRVLVEAISIFLEKEIPEFTAEIL